MPIVTMTIPRVDSTTGLHHNISLHVQDRRAAPSTIKGKIHIKGSVFTCVANPSLSIIAAALR